MNNKEFDFSDIEWVWFDLDDTLWDFATNSHHSLEILYSVHRLSRFFETADAWRECYVRHNHALWELYNAGKITREYLQFQRFFRPLEEAGCDPDIIKSEYSDLNKDYLEILGSHSLLIDGARELLKAVKKYRMKCGIISNGFNTIQFSKLRSSDLTDAFDCIVLSDEININKPDRRIFDHALLKSGATREKSVFIGDNPDTDIAGGAGAGWKTIYFNRDGLHNPAPDADLEVTALPQITSLIQRKG